MSIISWYGHPNIQLKIGRCFDREKFTRFFPLKLQAPLLDLIGNKEAPGSIKNIHQLCWDILADAPEGGVLAVLQALFQLDTLFCSNQLQLQFGPPGSSPLALLQVCGHPSTTPIARISWSKDHGERGMILSRLAYMHRFGEEFVLERPLSQIRCLISSKLLHQLLFSCSSRSATGNELLGECPLEYRTSLQELLGVLCQAKFLDLLPLGQQTQKRAEETNGAQVQWDFHDLLFHCETSYSYAYGTSEYGFGRTFSHCKRLPPKPGFHPGYPGEKIALSHPASDLNITDIPLERALQQRQSLRDYDLSNPLTKEEIGIFLSRLYRGGSRSRLDNKDNAMEIIEPRSYPSGGSLYEQEIYISVFRCKGLSQGFYHYDAPSHSFVPLPFPSSSKSQMDYTHMYQSLAASSQSSDIVLHISSRFQRMAWKYSQIAYAISLKNVGAMYQAMYLIACSMKLAACGSGGGNANIFAQLTGQDPYIEGLVGEFWLGRPKKM